jgi:lysozyme
MIRSKPSRKVGIAAAVAMAIAIPAEGLRQVAYYDPPGVLTVCYGTTGPDVVKGKTYTIDECNGLLTRDMLKAVDQVDRCVPDAPEGVLIAFGDAAYNLGPKIACDTKSSTAARMLAAGDWAGACDQLLRWNKARVAGVMIELPGLTKRRALERSYCVKDLT